jgi:hypothetical protein
MHPTTPPPPFQRSEPLLDSPSTPPPLAGLTKMLSTPGVGPDWALFYAASFDEFGAKRCHPLLPNGDTLAVTDKNKFAYANALAKFFLSERVALRAAAFVGGVCDVIPPPTLRKFSVEELRTLFGGTRQIDVADLRAHAVAPREGVVDWLWTIVRQRGGGNDSRAQLERGGEVVRRAFVQFATGAPQLPFVGAAGLEPPLSVEVLPVRGGGGDCEEGPKFWRGRRGCRRRRLASTGCVLRGGSEAKRSLRAR